MNLIVDNGSHSLKIGCAGGDLRYYSGISSTQWSQYIRVLCSILPNCIAKVKGSRGWLVPQQVRELDPELSSSVFLKTGFEKVCFSPLWLNFSVWNPCVERRTRASL